LRRPVPACPDVDSRHPKPPSIALKPDRPMKINKWVLAAILFLFAAGMYAAVIVKMS
jgi:hypothetical protein